MPKITSLTHTSEKRTNIPTAEYQTLVDDAPIKAEFDRRNKDLDPQLVWKGKDLQMDELLTDAPPLYIQEKIHPKFIIDDLKNDFAKIKVKEDEQSSLFGDFNGIPEGIDKTDFYSHSQNWTNRFILGDSLQVMASLAEREGLRGKIQTIYIDPPYGIKFNSNFQWSATSRDVKDGKAEHITREPEQVKAFRDTWRYGIHSYLSYLRDRLTISRELLAESGSCFVQIGDENVHRVRAIMDEVFGEELALARARLIGAKYPYYKLEKNDIRYGFEYQKVPHITLKSIANNTEIDEIWEKYKDHPELEKQRQKEIDASIAAKAELETLETLYDKPLEDKIEFESLELWPGKYICASGNFGKKAAIFIGPEFGTVNRSQLVEAAKEAAEGNFDVLISCAFNYDAHCTELSKIGKMQIIKARMNADLHLASDLKNTGKGNLFVIFGEPDIDIIKNKEQYQIKINGVDVFDPSNGEVRSSEINDIACWFIDTNYNGESFFVRHAYFLGQDTPYKQLKITLKSEINQEAWESLHSDMSRPFQKPETGKVAVKVINHLGDEAMKVFEVRK